MILSGNLSGNLSGMLGNMLGFLSGMLGKWLGKDVRKNKGVFRRCTKRKNPGKPAKNPIFPYLVKIASFGVQEIV